MEAFLLLVAGNIGSALAEEASKGASSLLGSEVSLRRRINASMSQIKSELEHIQAFLDGIDAQRCNGTVKPWLKRVRKIAHDTEDVIDEYKYLSGEQSQSGCSSFICRVIKKAPTIRAWHSIADRLKQIENDVAHAATMKERYDIRKLHSGVGGSSLIYANKRDLNPASSSFAVEDDQIVGMIEERKTLIKWLKDEAPRHSIISVWGMGGLGKTTLVNKAYKSQEIEKHFDLRVWVSVSQSFQDTDLLRRILKGLLPKQGAHDIESFDFASLVEKGRDFLQEKRYLVVLDDVWHPNAFFSLQRAFHNHKLGSKIVITTRIHEVASLADQQCQMELPKLNQNEAWDLFCKKAFWKDDDWTCPQAIEEWGWKIVEKCEGLPLAIVAIARLMSLRRQTEMEWKHVYERLSWEFTNNPSLDSVKHILSLSYDDLPGYLKNCFLYCSIFPEDHKISKDRLIRLWVAEGFVEARGTQTLEEVAEDFLEELIHRCMLQVAQWYGEGETCQMHDLVRELTLATAAKENFSIVWMKSQSARLDNEARRLSVHECPTENVPLSRNIRSLVVFDSGGSPSSLLSTILSKARYLRVLDLKNAKINRVPYEVGELFNLHYLSLRGTAINRLPNSLGRLRNLQTLDAARTKIVSFPKGMSRLKNLRHLLTGRINYNEWWGYGFFSLIRAPKGLWRLTSLQELEIAVDDQLVGRLGNLTQLRKLYISKVQGSHCPQLCTALSQMPSLKKLMIVAYDEEEELQLQGFGPVLKNVEMFCVHGRLVGRDAQLDVLTGFLGDNIRLLWLGWTGLKEEHPLRAFSRLSYLTTLTLRHAYDGKRLCFGAGWFPKLKTLQLSDLPHLDNIKMEKGSLESLQVLRLLYLVNLEQVPEGIEFQARLKVLSVVECNPLLVQMIKGEQKRNVDHIPTIQHWDTDTWWMNVDLLE